MRIGYITQKIFNKDGENISYLGISMQIPGIANMLEFTLSETNSDNPNSPTYHLKLPRLKSNLATNIIVGSLWLRTSQHGNEYMSGYIDSPIFNGGRIEIMCFKPYADDNPAILWNIIWEPLKKQKEQYAAPDLPPVAPPAPTPAKTTPKELHSDFDSVPF